MEEERIQKFKDLILNKHYCEDCNELCSIGEAFPLEFVAQHIIKLEKEKERLIIEKATALQEVRKYKEIVKGYKDRVEELKQEITVLQNTKDTCPSLNTSGVRCSLKESEE